jgi:hypothetical protein
VWLVLLLAAGSWAETALADDLLPQSVSLRPGRGTKYEFQVSDDQLVTLSPSSLPGIDVSLEGAPANGKINMTLVLTAQPNMPSTNYNIEFLVNGSPNAMLPSLRLKVTNTPPRINLTSNPLTMTTNGLASVAFEVSSDFPERLIGTYVLDDRAKKDGISANLEHPPNAGWKLLVHVTGTNAAGHEYYIVVAFTDGVNTPVMDVVVVQVANMAPIAPKNLEIKVGNAVFTFLWIHDLPKGGTYHDQSGIGGWVEEDVVTQDQLQAVVALFAAGKSPGDLADYQRLIDFSNTNRRRGNMVTSIDWYMANQFCQVLTKVDRTHAPNWRFDLPGIAQWRFFAKNNIVAAYKDVPNKFAVLNAFGLANLIGSCWQWTSDQDPDGPGTYLLVGGSNQPPSDDWSRNGGPGGDPIQKGSTDFNKPGLRMVLVPERP